MVPTARAPAAAAAWAAKAIVAGAPPSAEGGARPAPTAEERPPAPRGSRLAHPAAVRGYGPAGLGLSARTFLEIIWPTQPRSRANVACGLLLRRRARKIASCRPFCIWTRCSRCSSAASSRRWARLLLAGGKHGTCAARHGQAQAPVPAQGPDSGVRTRGAPGRYRRARLPPAPGASLALPSRWLP